MNDEIKLRDFFVAQLMNSKVSDFYSPAHRKNIAKCGEEENWILITAEEATQERIENAAKMAYKIADVLLKVRNENQG